MLSLIGMPPVHRTSWRVSSLVYQCLLAFVWILYLWGLSFNFCLSVLSIFFFFLQIFHLNVKAEASKNVRNKLVLVCDNKAKPCCPFTCEIPEWSDLFMGVMTSLKACWRDLGWLLSQISLNLQKKSGKVNAAIWLQVSPVEGRWCRREGTHQVNT